LGIHWGGATVPLESFDPIQGRSGWVNKKGDVEPPRSSEFEWLRKGRYLERCTEGERSQRPEMRIRSALA